MLIKNDRKCSLNDAPNKYAEKMEMFLNVSLERWKILRNFQIHLI